MALLTSDDKIMFEWIVKDFATEMEKEPGINITSPVFECLGARWRLFMYPYGTGQSTKGYISLYVRLLSMDPVMNAMHASFEFSFRSKGGDKHFSESVDHVFLKPAGTAGVPKFASSDHVLQKMKQDLLSEGALTVMCALECREIQLKPVSNVISVGVQTDSETASLFETSCDGLCQDMWNLIKKQACLDTILKLGEQRQGAHRAVLAARSSVFAAMFNHPKTNDHADVVSIVGADTSTLKDMLDYLYTSQVQELTVDKAKKLFAAADLYGVDKLKTACREFLLANLSVENACEVVVLADDYGDRNMLQIVSSYILGNLAQTLRTSSWENLQREKPSLAHELLVAYASGMGK